MFVIGAFFHDHDVWFQVLSSDVDVVAGGTGLIFSTVGVLLDWDVAGEEGESRDD